MIRVATIEDMTEIISMGKAFIESLDFPVPHDINDIAQTIYELLINPDAVIFIGEGGMVGGELQPYYLKRDIKLVSERFWWVDPDKRKGGLGGKLREAFEDWARANGATLGAFMTVGTGGDESLKSDGYFLTEKIYWRQL